MSEKVHALATPLTWEEHATSPSVRTIAPFQTVDVITSVIDAFARMASLDQIADKLPRSVIGKPSTHQKILRHRELHHMDQLFTVTLCLPSAEKATTEENFSTHTILMGMFGKQFTLRRIIRLRCDMDQAP